MGRFAISFFGLTLVSLSLQAATTSIQGAQGLVVSVETSGSYNISVTNPAWRFAGSTGHALSNVAIANGLDAVGPYTEIGFDFTATVGRHGAIRAYANQTSVLFTLSYPNAGAPFAFPNLNQYPLGLNHVAFSGNFAPPTFSAYPEESPWAFFDPNGNTFILSPASHFMTASLAQYAGSIQSSFAWQITSVPQGYTQQTLLVVDSGINRAFGAWGQALTALQGKARPANDADISLKSLGYWTDNGATYYYRMENGMSYIQTLAAVKNSFDQSGIGLGYLQLDSWFYPKGPQAQWADAADGFYQYDADSDLFGSSLAAFQQTVGIPLLTHARWIDPSSPYRQQYTISGNVSTDPGYWSMVAAYLKSAGVATYEQDWLSAQAQTAFNLTDPDLFLDGMSNAMAQSGLTMQYCMPTTRHVMQSARYDNLTTIRGANDRFNPDKWTPFLYSSRLISALGAWPFADVLMSTETSNLLLSTLSAGPVGIGDKLGAMNTANVLRAVRQDGVIVKPDAPITPIDATFQNDAVALATAPMVASTYTDFGALQAHYLFAYPQGAGNQFSFQVSDLGWTSAAYVYDYFNNTGRAVLPTDVLNETITNGTMYLVVAPIGQSGLAVIGDANQFVTLGRKRITALTDDGSVHVAIAYAAGEASRTLLGYSPWSAPQVTALNGSVGPVDYDAASGRFSVTVLPGVNSSASIRITPAAGNAGHAPIHPSEPTRPANGRPAGALQQ